ncbi:hypothetical protein AB0M46_13570 [Dactylosporangium sp. NPDC051485]|uniref:zinc finger domain-containing protein n=1 Tax=Dactylosporangium sp. NPDC051485 TaxID=3154846 RepID=UPI003442BB85
MTSTHGAGHHDDTGDTPAPTEAPPARGDPDRTQAMPRPRTQNRYRELLAAGRLVDLAGRALTERHCPWCNATTIGATCPLSLPCPTCHAAAGRHCRRPSGHQVYGGGVHASREAAAATADRIRQRDGDPDLPAPWPPDLVPAAQLALF